MRQEQWEVNAKFKSDDWLRKFCPFKEQNFQSQKNQLTLYLKHMHSVKIE